MYYAVKTQPIRVINIVKIYAREKFNTAEHYGSFSMAASGEETLDRDDDCSRNADEKRLKGKPAIAAN